MGRLFERRSSEPQAPVLERGRVLVWDPPTRLAFTWRAGNFSPDENTHVEVLFESRDAGTCVTLRHSGWAALRPDHPARHGRTGVATTYTIGRWWGELLSGLREQATAVVKLVKSSPAFSSIACAMASAAAFFASSDTCV